jgi:HEAT repeat protein/thiol-disulfide isomerase/thioredoxin
MMNWVRERFLQRRLVAVAFLCMPVGSVVFAQEAAPENSSLFEEIFKSFGVETAAPEVIESAPAKEATRDAEESAADATENDASSDEAADDSIMGAADLMDDPFGASALPDSTAPDEEKDVVETINPLDEFDEAVKLSQLHQRPILVVFGAKWCSWCRKLEEEFAKEGAEKILTQWVVVKIDVDDYPEIATQMQANALPGLRVLGFDQSVIASKEGFLPIDELQAWLDESLSEADPKIQKVLYDTGALTDAQIPKLIDYLGHRSPSIRNAAQQRLVVERRSAAKVVDALRSGGLSQQLSALQILQSWNAPITAIDPWRPETLGGDSLQSLIEWLRKEPDSDGPAPEMEPSQSLSAEDANQLITRFLASSGATRDGLIAQAVTAGKSLLPEVRQRLANSSELDDAQRIDLRELYYQLLAGEKTRLESSGLLAVLGGLEAEPRRKAASKLLRGATSQDQPLVDELSQDSDPLIREASVNTLQSLGGLRDRACLTRLLSDKSPSVRTAVLRVLAESPDDGSIETLIEYIGRETDEDLLVYATKTLGHLGEQAGVEAALCRLATNESWRVRAAALDAMKAKLDDSHSLSYSGFSGESDEDVKSVAIAETVLKATEDSDAFVVERAVALIPLIVSKKTAPAVIAFLEKHPGRVADMEKAVEPSELEQTFAPLVEESLQWLGSEDTAKLRLAAGLVSRLQPAAMRDRIPELLSSNDPSTQVASIRALLACLGQLRDEQLEGELGYWQIQAAKNKSLHLTPWHQVPESFLALPPSTLASEKTVTPTDEQGSGLSIFDSFFGGAALNESPGEAPDEAMEASADQEASDGAAKSDDSEAIAATLTLDLFGLEEMAEVDVSVTDEPVTEADADEEAEPESSTESTASKPVQRTEKAVLASQWLAQWHGKSNQEESTQGDKPDWVREVEDKLASLVVSTSAEQRPAAEVLPWLQLALLACGHADQMDAVLATASLSQTNVEGQSNDAVLAIPAFTEILPWLSSSVRTQALESAGVDWKKVTDGKVKDVLNAATVVDDFSVAEWILENAEKAELDASSVAKIRPFLLRALIGAHADSLNGWVPSSQLEMEKMQAGVEKYPHQQKAIDWCAAKYREAKSDWSKALLLSVFSYLDHSMAAESAIGLICEAKAYDKAVQAALAISLLDENSRSVDRAMQWLTHPVPEVQAAACERLVKTSEEFAERATELGAVLIYDSSGSLPGLWDVRRDFPKETLVALSESEGQNQWYAKVLLLATGGEISLEEVAKGHDDKGSVLGIIAALAKAGRADAEAIEYMRAATKSLTSYGDPAKAYAMIRNLKGSEATSLRKEMRDSFGADVLRR